MTVDSKLYYYYELEVKGVWQSCTFPEYQHQHIPNIPSTSPIPPIDYEWIMSTNITAISNTGQTVPICKEERSVSKDVTDDNDVTALTALLATEDKASKIDEYCSGEDVTQDKQERLRLMMSTDETRGNKSHQTDQQLQ